MQDVKDIRLFSNNLELYNVMLEDFRLAQKSIHIEIYRITRDSTGQLFRDALAQACSRGVKVKLLIDAWGTGSSMSFFSSLIESGGEVRAFNTLRLGTRLFTQNHRRNHRKIFVIDDKICYFGSSNITSYSVVWRELMFRIEGTIAKPLRQIVELDFKTHKKYSYNKRVFTRMIHSSGFEIIRDIPSIYKQKVMRKYLYLIKKAKESVYIETPYFLPGFRLRKAMSDACERGVGVTVVLPRHSDVHLVDVLRNRYLGLIHKSGVNIKYYENGNLHSKLMLVDSSIFCVGSSNFDYRSFRYTHEIIISGKNSQMLQLILNYVGETLQWTRDFDYQNWEKRPNIEKFISWLLVPFRYLF